MKSTLETLLPLLRKQEWYKGSPEYQAAYKAVETAVSTKKPKAIKPEVEPAPVAKKAKSKKKGK